MKRQTGEDRYFFIIFGYIGAFFTVLFGFISSGDSQYEDTKILFQSLGNPNKKITIQMAAAGFDYCDRDVYVVEYTNRIRYCKVFKKIKLSGVWVKIDPYTYKKDTLKLKNFIYTSETNQRR